MRGRDRHAVLFGGALPGIRRHPGPSAHLAILDLAAALLAFGAVRSIDELIVWLRKEAPARARELMVAVSKASLADAPPSACLRTPTEATWH